jgi:hypothetical protein
MNNIVTKSLSLVNPSGYSRFSNILLTASLEIPRREGQESWSPRLKLGFNRLPDPKRSDTTFQTTQLTLTTLDAYKIY